MVDITLLLTIASIVIPVCATLYTTMYTVMSRVKAEHKPYIILHKIEQLSKLDKYLYFITMLGSKIKNKEAVEEIESRKNIDVLIKLRNIGYGVATNIKFYDLSSGKKIYGNQEIDDDQIQKLFTTFDIGAGEEKNVQTSLLTKENESGIIEDTNRILCVYQDLNNNVYDFLFVINIKKGGGYNYYAYQPSSHSYNKIMKKFKSERKKILRDYKK